MKKLFGINYNSITELEDVEFSSELVQAVMAMEFGEGVFKQIPKNYLDQAYGLITKNQDIILPGKEDYARQRFGDKSIIHIAPGNLTSPIKKDLSSHKFQNNPLTFIDSNTSQTIWSAYLFSKENEYVSLALTNQHEMQKIKSKFDLV